MSYRHRKQIFNYCVNLDFFKELDTVGNADETGNLDQFEQLTRD